MFENLFIEQIRPELTFRLRNEVLYPDQPLTAMKMDIDDDGLHFGAFYSNQLVSVVSLFENGTDYQFRKFAVATHWQNQGIGKNVLQYISDFALLQGGMRIWCNARADAVPFYNKSGFKVTGESFSRNGINYQIVAKQLAPEFA